MPTSMILRRSEILAHIAAGKSNTWIARNFGHGRELIRQIRAALEEDLSQICVLATQLAPLQSSSLMSWNESMNLRQRIVRCHPVRLPRS
jgi:hypothetical protein